MDAKYTDHELRAVASFMVALALVRHLRHDCLSTSELEHQIYIEMSISCPLLCMI